MIQAPLQLSDYWVESISVQSNSKFDPKRTPDLDLAAINVDSSVEQMPSESEATQGTGWIVRLFVEQQLSEGKNIPYGFAITMTGVVFAHPALTGEKLQRSVQVNAPSMLFGVAREIIRAATGRGPYAPIIIPSTNFLAGLPKKELPATTEPGATDKPAAEKSAQMTESKPRKTSSRKGK